MSIRVACLACTALLVAACGGDPVETAAPAAPVESEPVAPKTTAANTLTADEQAAGDEVQGAHEVECQRCRPGMEKGANLYGLSRRSSREIDRS